MRHVKKKTSTANWKKLGDTAQVRAKVREKAKPVQAVKVTPKDKPLPVEKSKKVEPVKVPPKYLPGAPPRKRGHYITNAQLLPEVLRAKGLGYVTNELARMFKLITERYATKSWFSGWSFRDDMVSFALLNLCANGLKFNPARSSNPFAFYTTAIRRSFLQYMAEERKHRNIRDSLLLDAGANPSLNFMQNAHEQYAKEHGSDHAPGQVTVTRGDDD